MSLQLVLMMFAFVLLAVAAFNVNSSRVSLGWAGLAFWALAIILGGVHLSMK